ncbi:hypothetical protein LSG31_22000 [Fodinisporobacter ferrooxydans]|uniref:Uncharacterized protein n=1 Tax=Fodinisporobacter ferrooxydans TaxID=2901836 RepID=A0ABY4CLY5_9BACL|nr:hypothetical protein LSG31_22000 [Alicyclobacillaceae bacterium MYW30-H2]
MDQEAMRKHIQEYVLQSYRQGTSFATAFDIAATLNVPVTLVDQALHGFRLPDGTMAPYDSATEF